MSTQRRVVVTGLGVISPIGNNVHTTWSNALQPNLLFPSSLSSTTSSNNDDNNKTNKETIIIGGGGGGGGLTTLTDALTHQNLPPHKLQYEMEVAKALPCQVAAPVRNLLREDSRTSRVSAMALTAGEEAIRHSGLDSWLHCHEEEEEEEDDIIRHRRDRVGVSIGVGVSSIREITSLYQIIDNHDGDTKSIKRVSPHFVPKILNNSPTSRLSLEYNLRGPHHSSSTACTAGIHALVDAIRSIRDNDADVMVCGGAEACLDPWSMAGFCRLRALSTGFNSNNDRVREASRPFDMKRDGFVMGEGCGILVLEELEHAKKRLGDGGRSSKILAEVVGYGGTGDGYHVTSPRPDGMGGVRAMEMALNRAHEYLKEHYDWYHDDDNIHSMVDYVNAHATSTPKGDDIEAKAIEQVLVLGNKQGMRKDELLVSSTKGVTGHLLGAAGSLEALFAVMSIVDNKVPPTNNLSVGVDNNGLCDLFRHVTDMYVEREVRLAMSNSFGFGGTNSSIIFADYNE